MHLNSLIMDGLHLWGYHIIYYLAVVALVLPRIPYVGKFFNIINTLIHEIGHAIMALITSGEVLKVQVFFDTSGLTTTKSNSGIKRFFVSIAGYPFASAMAYVGFMLLGYGYEKWIVVGLSALFLLTLIFWIRDNTYGIVWVCIFVAINAFIVFYLKNETVIEIAAWFYCVMMLMESVVSALDLCRIAIRTPQSAGDATNLKKQTHIPAILWSLLFLAFAGFMGYESIQEVWPLIAFD